MTEVQESQHIPDVQATEQALVSMRETRREIAQNALQVQQRHEAQRDAAQQAVDRLGIVHAAINARSKALREKMTTERAAALEKAVEALAEEREFDCAVISGPADRAELDGLMILLADVAEQRMPAARYALAVAEIEASESAGVTMLRVSDLRAAETLRLSVAAAEFEGGRDVTAILPEDGFTANLRRKGRLLIETADSQRRALARVTTEKR